jgi:hypothetical protein
MPAYLPHCEKVVQGKVHPLVTATAIVRHQEASDDMRCLMEDQTTTVGDGP